MHYEEISETELQNFQHYLFKRSSPAQCEDFFTTGEKLSRCVKRRIE